MFFYATLFEIKSTPGVAFKEGGYVMPRGAYWPRPSSDGHHLRLRHSRDQRRTSHPWRHAGQHADSALTHQADEDPGLAQPARWSSPTGSLVQLD